MRRQHITLLIAAPVFFLSYFFLADPSSSLKQASSSLKQELQQYAKPGRGRISGDSEGFIFSESVNSNQLPVEDEVQIPEATSAIDSPDEPAEQPPPPEATPATDSPDEPAKQPPPPETHVSEENPEGIFANLQVIQWPFAKNWAHLESAPTEFWLEVGANSRAIQQGSKGMQGAFARGAFLITFEPLLDKYAYIHSRGPAQGPIGLQHNRAVVLPFAVGCKGSATFHVAGKDGCSSLLPGRGAKQFEADQKRYKQKWAPWVVTKCANTGEKRTVPCISLEEVIRDWLGGHLIKHLKIDAQGFDLNVLRSSGSMMDRIESVRLEVQCDNVAMIYQGQPNCTSTYLQMLGLGWSTSFDPKVCLECRETDISFSRQVNKNLHTSSLGLDRRQSSRTNFARVLVANRPFFKVRPPEITVEVGIGNSDFSFYHADSYRKQRRGALLTFEPRLRSYALLLRDMGAVSDRSVKLGFFHKADIAFPFAVGCSGSMTMSGVVVPCISLEEVIQNWIEGQVVTNLRIDADDLSLQVVQSARSMINKLRNVYIKVRCDSTEYSETGCLSTQREMEQLGFKARFDSQICTACPNKELSFTRHA